MRQALMAAGAAAALVLVLSPAADAHDATPTLDWTTRPASAYQLVHGEVTAFVLAEVRVGVVPAPGGETGHAHATAVRWTVTRDGEPYEATGWCMCTSYARSLQPGTYILTAEPRETVIPQGDEQEAETEDGPPLTASVAVRAPAIASEPAASAPAMQSAPPAGDVAVETPGADAPPTVRTASLNPARSLGTLPTTGGPLSDVGLPGVVLVEAGLALLLAARISRYWPDRG